MRSGGRNRRLRPGRQRDAGQRLGTTVVEAPVEPPSPLSGRDRREWDRITRLLIAHGILTELDLPLVYAYCRLFGSVEGQRAEAERLLRQLRGRKVREQVELRRQAMRLLMNADRGTVQLRAFLLELGASPLARSRFDPAAHPMPFGFRDELTKFDTPLQPLVFLQGGRRDDSE